MLPLLKGIHPGLFLSKELTERGLPSGQFALSLGAYPQTLSAIIRGRRAMNVGLALKIEKALGLEEGLLMVLQTWYDIEQEKKKQTGSATPNLSLLRPALFWDTDINRIDWIAQKEAVIKRVMERGLESEKAEIQRFYQLHTPQSSKP